jgi:hypothetical protein
VTAEEVFVLDWDGNLSRENAPLDGDGRRRPILAPIATCQTMIMPGMSSVLVQVLLLDRGSIFDRQYPLIGIDVIARLLEQGRGLLDLGGVRLFPHAHFDGAGQDSRPRYGGGRYRPAQTGVSIC